MRVLVAPNDLALGGSSLNAVELAAALQARGHRLLLAAPPGPLLQRVDELGLDYVPVPYPGGRRPEAHSVRALWTVARRFRPDVVHSWEFGAWYSAFFGCHVPLSTPLLATVMSMELPRSLPRTTPLTMGTQALVEDAAARRKGPVHLLEPPVDTGGARAAPGAADAFHAAVPPAPATATIVVVSRLATAMKLEGILSLVAAVDRLASRRPVRLVVVGDGDGRESVLRAAAAVDERHGGGTVVLAGPMTDPRSAYQAADVVVGMGSSALRAMATGKPVVVVGVDGFVKAVTPTSFGYFDRHGFWGTGGTGAADEVLAGLLDGILADAAGRRRLGAWGQELVSRRYSLAAVGDRLEALYVATGSERVGRGPAVLDALATAGRTADPRWRLPLRLARRAVQLVRPPR